MSRLGVPIVDAARIVEGQAWASNVNDGRHFHKIVPIEVRYVARGNGGVCGIGGV